MNNLENTDVYCVVRQDLREFILVRGRKYYHCYEHFILTDIELKEYKEVYDNLTYDYDEYLVAKNITHKQLEKFERGNHLDGMTWNGIYYNPEQTIYHKYKKNSRY